MYNIFVIISGKMFIVFFLLNLFFVMYFINMYAVTFKHVIDKQTFKSLSALSFGSCAPKTRTSIYKSL
jgi:hypothetical protein